MFTRDDAPRQFSSQIMQRWFLRETPIRMAEVLAAVVAIQTFRESLNSGGRSCSCSCSSTRNRSRQP